MQVSCLCQGSGEAYGNKLHQESYQLLSRNVALFYFTVDSKWAKEHGTDFSVWDTHSEELNIQALSIKRN